MKYFGTDGIRQKAELFTPEFVTKIVKGLTDYAGNEIKVLIGGDTRESTEWILQDFATALESFGVEFVNVGILPTPAINHCFYEMDCDFAIDITASHNPYTDNGIKIFERGKESGEKLSQKGCEHIEKALASDQTYALASPTEHENSHDQAIALYFAHLLKYIGNVKFSDLNIALDCANGATSVVAEKIFKQFGAKITLINSTPTFNTKINHDCGSTHLKQLINTVTSKRLDFGIAFDGDGDRCIIVDASGNIIDGDGIIAIIASYLKLDAIVITVMANQGLLNWAKDNHITTEITAVGDSNVASAMKSKKIQIGGEQSGHIILPGESTGDGILTGLMVSKIVSEIKAPLSNIFVKSPQVIVNIPADSTKKQALKTSEAVKSLLLDYSKKLEKHSGRLLVRPSGTEPLIRITMWGDDKSAITKLAEELKLTLHKSL